ncbi:MAG: T9SS type A sorting domain-containing protein [Phaeodactylibacter sp.]|nr:T9SS type A sorting domain-containing protein [Phaeodactylibacter sp.]
MKRFIFTLLSAMLLVGTLAAQESYTAYKVTGNNVPVIDGTIDPIWSNVQKVALEKVPELDGAIHPNITVPFPDAADYSAEYGAVWNEAGLYFYFKVVDDMLVIEDDYYVDNGFDADQWWTDDNINILFSKDLVNTLFTQWEFAWQPGVDQEEKLSSDLWANPAVIDGSLVSSAWYNDGTTWILETFIDWGAFADGTAVITEGMEIYLEVRARDDDDGGTWESMFHWSTTNYQVENTGEGMGTMTLSGTEVTGLFDVEAPQYQLALAPNPSNGQADLRFVLDQAETVQINLFDLTGQLVKTLSYDLSAGLHNQHLDLQDLQSGIYLVQLQSASGFGSTRLVKE